MANDYPMPKNTCTAVATQIFLDQLSKNNLSIAGEIKTSFNLHSDKIKGPITNKFKEFSSKGKSKYAEYVKNELMKGPGVLSRIFGK